MIIDWDADPVLLKRLKLQARIDTDYADDLLKGYVDSALSHVEMHCDRKLVKLEPGAVLAPDEMELTPDVWQAVAMLMAHWFANPEAVVTGTISSTVQLGVERLLWYRKRF